MLKWHRVKDPDLDTRVQSDNTPVLATIYADFDWRCNILIPDGGAHMACVQEPKSLAQAKRECEAAAAKLLAMREFVEGMK